MSEAENLNIDTETSEVDEAEIRYIDLDDVKAAKERILKDVLKKGKLFLKADLLTRFTDRTAEIRKIEKREKELRDQITDDLNVLSIYIYNTDYPTPEEADIINRTFDLEADFKAARQALGMIDALFMVEYLFIAYEGTKAQLNANDNDSEGIDMYQRDIKGALLRIYELFAAVFILEKYLGMRSLAEMITPRYMLLTATSEAMGARTKHLDAKISAAEKTMPKGEYERIIRGLEDIPQDDREKIIKGEKPSDESLAQTLFTVFLNGELISINELKNHTAIKKAAKEMTPKTLASFAGFMSFTKTKLKEAGLTNDPE